MSIQLQSVLKRITNLYARDPFSVWYQILMGAGTVLDLADPEQIGLANQFTVTTATGAALDKNGADWGISRRAGESDASYRARILSELPAFAAGPTPAAMIQTVQPFTGVAPTYSERGQILFSFPISFPFSFSGNSPSDSFIIDLQMQNPNSITYLRKDVIAAVNAAKRAIATVYIWWEDGTNTVVN